MPCIVSPPNRPGPQRLQVVQALRTPDAIRRRAFILRREPRRPWASVCYSSKFFTTNRGFNTAAAPRSLALNRTTMSLLKSASPCSGDCVTVIGQFSI